MSSVSCSRSGRRLDPARLGVCAMVTLLLVGPARAADPTLSSLSWVRLDGAESCAAAPALARAVEGRLGRTVFVPPAEATLAVEGRVEHLDVPGGPTWRAVLRVSDRDGAVLGDRVVESRSPTCAELEQVAALTIALMIDPGGGSPPPPAPTPPPRWRFEIHAALSGGFGLVPGVAVGGRATGLVTPPRFVPIAVQGELVPFARVAEAAGRADLARAVAGLQLCPLDVGKGSVALRGCLGVDAGALLVLDASETLAQSEWVLVQGHAAVGARWIVIGPFLVESTLHGIVPLRDVRLQTASGEALYDAPPVAGLLDIGVGMAL